jgi:hypothetical protein
MSRPSKCTPVRRDAIRAALRAGNSRAAAARHARVDRETLRRWYNAGMRADWKAEEEGVDALTADERAHLDLYNVVEDAEVECEMMHVRRITEAAKRDWRASAFWLKCRRPDEWNDRDIDNDPTPAGYNSPIILVPAPPRATDPVPPGHSAAGLSATSLIGVESTPNIRHEQVCPKDDLHGSPRNHSWVHDGANGLVDDRTNGLVDRGTGGDHADGPAKIPSATRRKMPHLHRKCPCNFCRGSPS